MDPNSFPTKGNLILAQNSLALANQGYDLMDKKRNILIKELMNLMDEAAKVQEEIDITFSNAYVFSPNLPNSSEVNPFHPQCLVPPFLFHPSKPSSEAAPCVNCPVPFLPPAVLWCRLCGCSVREDEHEQRGRVLRTSRSALCL